MSPTTSAVQVLAKNYRLPPLPTIRDLIKMYKLRALKQLSQNFILDERITDKIVRAAGKIEGNYVLEIGPGPGNITRSIIKRCPRHLVVVEKDRRFIPSLELLQEATSNHMRMDIVRDDILKYRVDSAFPDCPVHAWEDVRAPVNLIGNLPFAISTRLLINWLKDVSERKGAWAYGRSSMTLTFQKEVSDRICAPIMAECRCRLSVMSQIWTRPLMKFLIPGAAFVPKPDVDVGVVTLIPLQRPLTNLPFDLVEKVVRHIFSMRQKYVRRGVATLFPEDTRVELTQEVFAAADVDQLARSFELSVEECLRIAQAYQDICNRVPGLRDYNFRACKTPKDVVNVV